MTAYDFNKWTKRMEKIMTKRTGKKTKLSADRIGKMLDYSSRYIQFIQAGDKPVTIEVQQACEKFENNLLTVD